MTTVEYDLINYQEKEPHRKIEVQATPEQLQSFAENGYLVLERVLTPEHLEELRNGLMEVVERENPPSKKQSYGREYGGIYARGLLDKHKAFHSLINFPPVTTVAQAMLGPRIQIRSFSGRVTYPDAPAETKWHIDNRSWIEPMPPFYIYPSSINCIYYLDDLTPETGGLGVVPGTHKRSTPPPDDFRDIPEEVVLYVPAGSVVMKNTGIWHRGRINKPGGGIRRNLLVGHSPIWMKHANFDGFSNVGGELTRPLIENGDPFMRDLLGAEHGLG
jgi:ectoine hydroxylase-related dioxygenase (phytanoyl-CoA dioxygenase family)